MFSVVVELVVVDVEGVFESSRRRGGDMVMWWTPARDMTSLMLVREAGRTRVLIFFVEWVGRV